MIFNKYDHDSKQRFSIRKLSLGVCSVLLSTLFLTMNDNQTVHAATESDQQETETSDSGDANRGLNIVTQSASQTQAATTTEMPSKSTQSEDSTTEPTHSEASRNETSQTKTVQNSVEIQKDNVENTSATNHNNTIVQSTEKPSTAQKTKTSNPDSSTTQTKSETNSLNQKNNANDAAHDTTTFNVSNLVAKASVNALQENKTAATTATTPTTNGGYDSATWGTLDTSKWTGQNTTFNGNNYYQLTGYTGDQTHIIVPNQADFEQAGKSTNNLQVSISNDLIKSWQNAATIAFSKTEDKKVKLASNNLNNTFQNDTNLTNLDANSLDTSSVTLMQNTFSAASNLSSLTGISDWDVSNVTNMSSLFQNATGVTSLSGLENWDVQKVTDMTRIFNNINKVTDLSPLSNWKTDSLQTLSTAFANNSFTNLEGLENWNVSHVTDMSSTFMGDTILNDLNALVKWDISNVTNLSMMFNRDFKLVTLTGLENWNTGKVTNLNATFANEGSLVDASAIANWNTSNVTNMSVLFAGSNAQYVDFSNWDFSKVTSASNVINNTQSVVYLGNNSTLTADKLNTLGIANGGFTQPIILTSGNLYTLLSNKNNNTHNITINNASGSHLTTISAPVVYDAASASNMTDAINSYKDMVDQKLEDYVTEHNYVLKRVSSAPVDDVTGHNNHLVNYANATYQVVTIPADQKKNLQIQDKTTYKGKTLTAKDLVTNVADFPAGTIFEFADNSEPNWDEVGTHNVKVIATYPVSVNGQQYTAVTTPATAKVTVTQQMQFTITYWDDTENKEITQFDIANAGNGAYSRLTFPDGVNTNNYQSVSVSGVPEGATVAGELWKPFTDPSCNWTVPNYKWDATAAPSLFDANVVVHLVHKTQDITNTDPAAQETRTVTADFVKINENGTPEAAPFDSATLDVYYIRKATKDLVTGKVTYGNWKLNTNKGTNGLQVVSGAWTLPTNSSADVTVNAPESPDGYVKVDSQVNGQSTTNFGTATNITSKLTTYYVPTSLTQKTINRVINLTPVNFPPAPSVTQTTTQSATITRPVRVNADDSGVVFEGFDGSGWTTGEWSRYNKIPVPNNYTKVIKQIVTHPDGTTTETTLDIPTYGSIPAQTVTIDTLPTVINITYTATATAFLAGTNESTYTGSPITLDDLNDGNGDNPIVVGITGPTGTVYTLQTGEVEFSSDKGQTWTTEMPTNAGTYELRWSKQGKQNIIKKFGNNSIKWVDAQGNSTFTSTATYIINPAPATFTLSNQTSGIYTKIYDAQPTTSIDPSKLTITANFNNAKVVLDTTGLTSDSYEWVDAQGNSISNPKNVGTYYIKLKDSALSTLQKDNPNFTLTNSNKLATYTITAAENTVSVEGTQTETYTGQPISVKYNANGNNSVQVSISAKDGATASLSNVQLDSGDFQIVDVSGKPIAATNAGGVYHIVLTDTGVAKIQKATGDNYKISQGTSFGTLVINKAQASAEFSGNPSSTYTGTPNSDYLNGFSIKLNEPNNPTHNLVAGDIEFNVDGTWTTNVPVNVGKYEVRLSQTGWEHIKEINSDNVTWSATASAGTGTYTITPATADTQLSGHNSMVYNGNSVTTADLYTDGSTIKVAISGNNIVNLPSSFTLEDGDYTWNTQDGKSPVNAGNYSLTLSSAGLDKIQAAIDEAVGKGNVILSKDNTGSATFQIEQAISSNVQLDGNEKSEYNGHAVSFDPTNEETKKNFGFNNVQGLTIPDLTADDFEWVDQDGNQITAPTNAGYYYLQLNEKGKSAFATANPNYTFVKDGNSTISGRITYHIYPASLIIGVSGTASQVYNGQNAAITQTQLDNGDIKLVWGNSNDEPIGLGSFTLTPEDLEVVDSAGNPVSHANAQENDKTGNPAYYVRLTSAALNKIKNLTGASNYDISLGNPTGDFLIYARKAQVTLNGNQTTTYGTDLPLDPSAYHIELTNWNSSVPGPTDAEIIQKIGGLKTGDVYINGFTDGQMPVNVGSYQVKITDQLLQRLQAAFPDYDWDAVSGNNGTARTGSSNSDPIDARHEPATYVITPADTTVTINGAEHIKYGESSTIQYGGDNGYSITITAPVKNATIDNEHEPIYTNLKLEAGDLEFVTTPGNVGTYEVKLSAQGLKKLQDLTGSTNYNWTQASAARANFFVDQMPVTITVGGNEQNVTYGSNDWLTAIEKSPQGYTLTVMTENGTTLNYQVKNSDLIFSHTPGNVGSYQVVLSSQGLDNLKSALGTNYAYPQSASDVTSYGTFNVNQGEVAIRLDGSDSKIYDGKATTPADLNTGKYNLTYSATVYAPDGTAQKIQLTAEDLQFANGDPINAGNYTVELSPVGQAKLKNLTGNNGDNYKWIFNTNATYTINTATDAGASLSGSNQMIFNGSAVTTAEINNGGDIIVNLTFPGSTENSIYHLQDGDYIWIKGESPTNVGTYTIKLTQAGLDHLQAAIDQYAGSGNVKISADSLTGSATFEIVPKSISDVTISGKDQEKTYDGQAASLDVKDLTINANDLVTDNPLSMKGIIISDFDWYGAQGNKLDAIPTNAGVYEARLKSSALQTLQKDNPNYSFNAASGMIKYIINQKAATDTLGGNGNKIYNSQGTSVRDVLNSITWTPGGLVDGQSLDLSKLSETDYAWYTKNADGTYTEITSLPTNAGTYYLKLKDSSIAKIQAANPNYSFATGAISGEYTYVINKANADVSISGSQTTKDLAFDSKNYQERVKTNNGQTLAIPKLTADDFVVVKDGQKIKISQLTEAGTYNVELSEDAINKIRQANPNYDIEFSSTATLTLENSSQTINYVDTDGNVISSTNISGHIKGTKLSFTPEIPVGWVASEPSDVPTEITINNGTTIIKIKHGTTNVDHNNPLPDGEKTVTGEVIDGAHEKDLNQTVTRTINVTKPDGTESTEVQTAKIYRNASYDNVTGEVTYGEWSTAKWSEFTPEKIAGYTPSENVVPAVEVKDGQKNVTVDITYTANKQSTNIIYQDKTGQVIKTDKVNGETDQTIDVHSTVPAGWKLVNGYTIPSTITFGPDGHKDVVVQVEPATITVTPDTPEDQIPNGKVPGNPDKTYPKMENLVSEPTRTIVVTKPDGTKETITQKVKFTRTATFDEVTGEVTYSDWKSADSAVWEAYTPATIEGYTPNVAQVEQETVSADTANVTVNISYTKNIVPPVEETQTIEYQDKDGKIIASETITGKKGQELSFTPHIPENWQARGEVPKTITIGENGNKTVIRIEPKIETTELTKTITRTIIEHLPSGDKRVVQNVTLTGIQSKNLVTGKVQTEWNSGKFVAYTPERVAGYTASPNLVGEEVVNATTENSTIEVTYVKDKVQASQVVQLVDSKGQIIASTTVVGELGQEVTYNLSLPTNWEYTNGNPGDQVKVENGVTKIAIQHKTEEVTDAQTVTETIHFKYADQSQALPDTIQTITFTRNGVKDLVTGKTVWGKWDKESSTFPEIVAPNISSYSPNPMTINAQTVGPNSQNLEFTVIYSPIKKPTPNPDNPVNPPKPDDNKPNKPDHNKPVEPNKPNKKPAKPVQPNNKPAQPVTPTIHKPSTKASDNKPLYEVKDFPRGSRKLDNGTIVDSHGRVLYENGKLTRLGRTMLKRGHEKVLPQTGQKDSENISWIGALLAGMGIFGLADRKKRKKKN